EKSLSGRALGDRGDDLQQLGADRHQCVVQPDVLDARVVKGDRQAEDVDELLSGDEIVSGDERDLANLEHGEGSSRSIAAILPVRPIGAAITRGSRMWLD